MAVFVSLVTCLGTRRVPGIRTEWAPIIRQIESALHLFVTVPPILHGRPQVHVMCRVSERFAAYNCVRQCGEEA
jgi:hypothetical protein